MELSEFLTLTEEILEVDTGSISLGDKLESVGWDSLANIGLIAAIDERFGVTVDADRLSECQTVEDIYSLLSRTVAAS